MGKRERTSDRLNAKQMDKLSEIYDFFDKNGDGSLVRQNYARHATFIYSFRHWRNLLIPLTHIWTDVQIITMKGMYQEKESFQSLEKLSNVLILTAMERKYSYNVFDMSMLHRLCR